VIEGNLDAIRIAVFAGFNKLARLCAEVAASTRTMRGSSGVGSKEIAWRLESLFPKTYFWSTVAAPHFWVRYEGLENGRATPKIVMELDRYQP